MAIKRVTLHKENTWKVFFKFQQIIIKQMETDQGVVVPIPFDYSFWLPNLRRHLFCNWKQNILGSLLCHSLSVSAHLLQKFTHCIDEQTFSFKFGSFFFFRYMFFPTLSRMTDTLRGLGEKWKSESQVNLIKIDIFCIGFPTVILCWQQYSDRSEVFAVVG